MTAADGTAADGTAADGTAADGTAADGTGTCDTGRDSGVATVWTAVAIAAVLALLSLILELGAAVGTRHRADSAADLAALAAAAAAPDGEPAACARARWVADGMRVRLSSCRLSGWDAMVEVAATPSGLLAPLGDTSAHARAGPADG